MTINNKKGFTVTELIITLSVFSILIAVVIGVFVSSLQNQRLAISMVEAQDNISLALEQMAREIRLGLSFQPQNSDYSNLSFYNVNNDSVSYQYDSNNQNIQRCSPAGANCQPITPTNIVIKDFTVQYYLAAGKVPLITINFAVASKDPRLKDIMPDYRVQTSVSARNY